MNEHLRPYFATICVLGSRMGGGFFLTSCVIDIVNICISVRSSYRTIILPIVSYGCESWSLIMRKKRRMFGNRVLRKIFIA